MEINEILGFFGALMIGLILGLIGGGGSILTLPILVYVLGINPLLASAYSLFVVGCTALIGTIQNFTKGFLEIRVGLIFAIPSLIGVYLTRAYFIHWLPEYLFFLGEKPFTKDLFIMLLFVLLMLPAAYFMINGKELSKSLKLINAKQRLLLAFEGLIVGVLTGVVGAGGGFLIVPVLVLLTGLEMKKAIATSLLIITIKSLIGFLGDLQNLEFDWNLLFLFTAISIVGIFVGTFLRKFISNKGLKKGFGYFVLLMAIYIISKEVINL